jgi:hypothetical protein
MVETVLSLSEVCSNLQKTACTLHQDNAVPCKMVYIVIMLDIIHCLRYVSAAGFITIIN